MHFIKINYFYNQNTVENELKIFCVYANVFKMNKSCWKRQKKLKNITRTWDRFKTSVSQITVVLRALDKHRPPFPVALAQRTNRITRRRCRRTKS